MIEIAWWWQILIIFLTAILTQLFAHIFLEHRNKKKRIIEAAANAIGYTRQIRPALSMYKQDEMDFEDIQNMLGKSRHEKDPRAFAYYEKVVLVKHDSVAKSQELYENIRVEFVKAAYLLRNLCYERLGEDKKFANSMNSIIGITFNKAKYTDVDELKKEIDDKILKHALRIEEMCGRELYIQTRSPWGYLKDLFSGRFKE